MRTASATAASAAGSVSARGPRAGRAAERGRVRGRIPVGAPKSAPNKVTTFPASAGSEPGRRAAALRSLVGTPGRTSRDARSAA